MASTKKSLDAESQWVELYNTDSEFRNKVNTKLMINCTNAKKAPNGFVTESWGAITGKTNKKEVSKSDVILGNVVGVSLKNGVGRATSSNFYETKAIFGSILNLERYQNDTELVNKVEGLFNLWSDYSVRIQTPYTTTTRSVKSGKETHEKLEQYIDRAKLLDQKVKQIVKEHPDYMADVMRECLTAEHKFGNTVNRANYYYEMEKNDCHKIKFACSVNSAEFRQKCYDLLKSVNIAMKSSGGGKKSFRIHWIRFM